MVFITLYKTTVLNWLQCLTATSGCHHPQKQDQLQSDAALPETDFKPPCNIFPVSSLSNSTGPCLSLPGMSRSSPLLSSYMTTFSWLGGQRKKVLQRMALKPHKEGGLVSIIKSALKLQLRLCWKEKTQLRGKYRSRLSFLWLMLSLSKDARK